MKQVLVLSSFDNLSSRHLRFLRQAAQLGSVRVLLLTDEAAQHQSGHPPKFPQAERQYFLEAVRYVDRVTLVDSLESPHALPPEHVAAESVWVVEEADANSAKREFCSAHAMEYAVVHEEDLQKFPPEQRDAIAASTPGKKKVIVTGCYDWFHSGHVRFFEEVAELGDLYVVVGHDENIKLLKGEGHPMFPAVERRFMAGSIRHVQRAFVSSGDGWLDAEPEMELVKPDIYAVNEDGDRPEKRAYCESHGIEYRVLKRLPKEGLPKRQSTDLRGF